MADRKHHERIVAGRGAGQRVGGAPEGKY